MPDDPSATGTRRCWHYNRDPQMGRHLVVTVRATSRPLDWLIIGARDARTHEHARLARWWSEQHTTATYAAASHAAGSGTGVQPDGHGIWHADGRTVGFFLEHGNGTEPLGTVLRKLRGYEQLATYGPRYPVLLRVPGRRREQHLLDALAGVPTAMPVATDIHGEHATGPARTLTIDPGQRRWLHELPSDHGPDNPATNPHRFPDKHEGNQ